MAERIYQSALERIVLLGADVPQWAGAVAIAKSALHEGVDYSGDNAELAERLLERETPA